MSSLYWQQIRQAYRARQVVWLILALVVFVIVWSAVSTLDQVVTGEGKVVPAQAVQQIQSLEGGILKSVPVREGQLVDQGDVLVVLDDTRFRAQFQESQQEQMALVARRMRLAAELQAVQIDAQAKQWNNEIIIQPKILQAADLPEAMLRQAQASFDERMQELLGQFDESRQYIEQQKQAMDQGVRDTQTLSETLLLVSEEVDLTREVVATGAVARVELLKLQREESSLSGELAVSKIDQQRLNAAREQAIAEHRSIALEFRSNAQQELAETDTQLARLAETMAALEDQLRRTQLTSSLRGNIKNIATRSLGGVIAPGEAMMEVVPLDDQLLIETRLAPQDIAFVHEGQQATVKFTAYDFVVYGGLKGEVIYIGADAQQDEEGITYYEVHVKTWDNHLNNLAIIPGMQARVDVLTGKQTILTYWLKPLLRARATAMREP